MALTERLYYNSVYQREFVAQVLECVEFEGKCRVALDRTCFYPGGGGQPCDTGVLGGSRVLECYSRDGVVYHILDLALTVSTGQEINGSIDFERRFAFLQNHTGEHILSGIAKHRYGATNIGFHMSERGITLDFDKFLDKDVLATLEQEANEVARRGLVVDLATISGRELDGLDIRSKLDFSGSQDVRIVSIPGCDICACAALHVENTLEIGAIKIVSHQKYKGGVRLNVFCGFDAFWDYSRKNDIVSGISRELSADTDSCIAAVQKLKSNNTELKRHGDALLNRIFHMRTDGIPDGTKFVYMFENGINPDDARRFANIAAERADIALILTKSADTYKYAACTLTESTNLQAFAQSLNDALNGRGGVTKGAAFGVLNADYDAVVAYLEAL